MRTITAAALLCLILALALPLVISAHSEPEEDPPASGDVAGMDSELSFSVLTDG